MTRFVILLICVFLPSITPYCNENEAKTLLKRAIYEFSMNLLPEVSQEKQNHFIVSPLSIWTLLYFISMGATGSTYAELQQVLRLDTSKCNYDKYQAIINKTVVSCNKSDVIMERSSNIFIDENLKINEKYNSNVINGDLCSFRNISFENPNIVAQEINKYVSEATHNTINETITPEDWDSTAVMILIDTVYFKGAWKVPFDAERTVTSPFYNDEKVTIGAVNLMQTSGNFNNRFIRKLQARVLEIPYGKIGENRYSMFFFLPAQGTSLTKVIEKMKKVNLAQIKKSLAEFGVSEVIARVPRFKITSNLNNLDELLEDMGLKTMFDSSQARFQEISDEQIFVSNVIQKADIEVTEEGTVGSAATGAEFSIRTSPVEFIFNKPFLFMIVDKKYDIPIFTGAYSKPTSY